MIVPVKKIRVLGLKPNHLEMVKTLQKSGKLMLLYQNEFNISGDDGQYLKHLESVIEKMEGMQKRKFFAYKEVTEQDYLNIEQQALVLLSNIDTLYEDIKRLENSIEKNKISLTSIRPFKNLSVAYDKFDHMSLLSKAIGYIPSDMLLAFNDGINHLNLHVEFLEAYDDKQYMAIAYDTKIDEQIGDMLKKVAFQAVHLPNHLGCLNEEVKLLNEQIIKDKANIATIREELKILSKEKEALKTYFDYLKNHLYAKQIKLLETQKTIYTEGWVRSDEFEAFSEEMSKANLHVEVLSTTNSEKVPTATKNNQFVHQFETITNMFSVPNAFEIDPNPIMSIWYWLIFGLMMGDIGYGIAMIVVFALYIKFKKPKGELRQLVYVFAYSGVSSIIFGILFGSFFGASVDILNIIGQWFGNQQLTSIILEPVSDPLPMLIVSLAIGVLHIMTGLILKMVKEIKRKHYFDALSEGLSWFLILLGIVLFILIKPVFIGISIIVTGVLLILLFKGHAQKGVFGKILSGFGGLYGVTSYLSDVLSYSRILALSLSTAVIAFTMNMLAGMVSGSFIGYIFAVIIYIGGHLFNFVMGLLSAYVHDGRLQYLEFFGKFYEGEGYAFTPFKYEFKYIDEMIKEKNI